MSRRLTDEEIERVYECTVRAAPVSRELRIRAMEELRQLRAQALTKEEREALGWARDVLANLTPLEPKHRRLDAASALSRLLGKEEG